MPEDLPDHRRVLDARQHPNLPPALLAGLDLNPEDPLEPLGLRKRPVPLRRGPQVQCRGLAPPRRRHLSPPPAVGREDPVVAGQVHPRFRHQAKELEGV